MDGKVRENKRGYKLSHIFAHQDNHWQKVGKGKKKFIGRTKLVRFEKITLD
jgi:hypothetical protein